MTFNVGSKEHGRTCPLIHLNTAREFGLNFTTDNHFCPRRNYKRGRNPLKQMPSMRVSLPISIHPLCSYPIIKDGRMTICLDVKTSRNLTCKRLKPVRVRVAAV